MARRRTRRRSPAVLLLSSGAIFLAVLGAWLLSTSLGGAAEPASAAPQLPTRPRDALPEPQARQASPCDPGLAELAEVRAWAEAEERDPKGVIRRLRLVAERYPGSRAAEAARSQVAEWEAKLKAAARQALDKALGEARTLAAGEEFGRAIELLDRFGEGRRELAKEAGEARGRILADATAAERELRQQAAALAEKGGLAAATALYQRIQGFGVPQFSARARHEIESLEARQAATRRQEAEAVRIARLGIPDLFAGACRLLDGGRRVELAYDFSDPAQLADWDLRGSHWELREGKLTLRGAQALLRAPVEGTLQATIELADATGPPGEWGAALAEGLAEPPLYTIVLPERSGQPVLLRAGQRTVARSRATLRADEPFRLGVAARSRGLVVAVDGREVLSWRAAEGGPPGALRLGTSAQGQRGVRVGGVRLAGTVTEAWAGAELEDLRARSLKRVQLEGKLWRSLFNGTTLNPWKAERGAWQVADGALTTRSAGSLSLPDWEREDLELRLKVRPSSASSGFRVAFRATRAGEHSALTLGSSPAECCLAHRAAGRTEEVLARFGERVDWRASRWYDLRIRAIGSELRAELDGALLCVVRDERCRRGSLSLEAPGEGVALKDIAIRALE